MSLYKGHLGGGIVVYGITLYAISQYVSPSFSTMIEWLVFCLAGALFPDIDIKSKGQRLFYFIMLCVMGYFILMGHHDLLVLLGLMAVIPLIARHRGLFHRLWFVIVAPTCLAGLICIFWFPACSEIIFYDGLFFVVGAVSHLWLDYGIRRLLGF